MIIKVDMQTNMLFLIVPCSWATLMKTVTENQRAQVWILKQCCLRTQVLTSPRSFKFSQRLSPGTYKCFWACTWLIISSNATSHMVWLSSSWNFSVSYKFIYYKAWWQSKEISVSPHSSVTSTQWPSPILTLLTNKVKHYVIQSVKSAVYRNLQ